jgi:glutamate N-acetyltransferase/amino-acid N-acetyltransferase
VEGARNDEEARKLVKSISDSNLVKTAMFGRDPNWGRIVSAAGNAGVPFDYTKATLFLGDEERQVKVLEKGVPQDYEHSFMKKVLRESHLYIKLLVGKGKGKARGWGSDLTTDYITFNSVYTT